MIHAGQSLLTDFFSSYLNFRFRHNYHQTIYNGDNDNSVTQITDRKFYYKYYDNPKIYSFIAIIVKTICCCPGRKFRLKKSMMSSIYTSSLSPREQLDRLFAFDAIFSVIFGTISLLAPHGIISWMSGAAGYNHSVHETLR